MVEEPMIYQLRFIGPNGPENRTSPNKRSARVDAKEIVESGETEELVVLDDKGRFVWFVSAGVSDDTRSSGGSLVYFFDEWPPHTEWKDVVGTP